jgi:hypothetical protein
MELGNTYDGALDDFTRPNAGDDKLLVQFYRGTVKDDDASVTQGRPIFHDVDYTRIYVPGDKTNIIDRPTDNSDKQRFPQQYARYLQGKKDEDQIIGTPLKEWPLVTRAQVEELKYFNLHTVEHLAEVADAVKLKMPGLVSLSRQAQAWLERTNVTAQAAMMDKTIADQANKIEALERAVSDLVQRNEALALKAGVAALDG